MIACFAVSVSRSYGRLLNGILGRSGSRRFRFKPGTDRHARLSNARPRANSTTRMVESRTARRAGGSGSSHNKGHRRAFHGRPRPRRRRGS